MDALVRASDLAIREDDDISPGGVVIETEAGTTTRVSRRNSMP